MSSSRALNILLVEDDDDHAGLFSEFLSAGVILWGAGRITRVSSLAEAQAYLRANHTDVVILDLGLPDSDGLDTLRAILRTAGKPAIVVLTAQDNRTLGLTSIELGAQDFLVKGEITEAMISQAVRYAHERKQNLLTLAERNLDLETYRQVISTDLRTPLRKIRFISETLDNEAGGQLSDKHRDYLKKLPELCSEMRAVLNGLECFVKVGGLPEDKEVPLAPLVEDVLDSLPEPVSHCIRVDELPEVLGDPALLRDVFTQLIDNALQFTSEREPIISVSAVTTDDTVTVTVADNGAGISASNLNRIFQAGIRDRGTHSEPSAGLGLAICERIVQSLGGRIWAESTPGEGSEFRFTLPAANPAS